MIVSFINVEFRDKIKNSDFYVCVNKKGLVEILECILVILAMKLLQLVFPTF